MTITLLQGDCRQVLATLPDRSVQTCVTSPPYFGLRDYGHAGQIGLEPTPAAYVAALVAVFDEVRRVLRDDGTLWVNLGDSYNSGEVGRHDSVTGRMYADKRMDARTYKQPQPRLGQKQLLGIPWRVAFALQDAGWVLRSDIIWHKPNPMPESVTDRPTKAHEYLFLLSKSERYFYDAAAIAEVAVRPGDVQTFGGRKALEDEIQEGDPRYRGGTEQWGRTVTAGTTRNRRSVWTVATRPYKEAHFATFPEALIEPCILAGSASRACERCGAPWERVVEREADIVNLEEGARQQRRSAGAQTGGAQRVTLGVTEHVRRRDLGFRPSCACQGNTGAGRSVVLDPFVGSGTTCRVAERYGRDSIGIDLSYADLQEQRTNGIQKVMVDLL
jgi:DNA modification methylase